MEKIIALYEKRKDSFIFDQEARNKVDEAWKYFRNKATTEKVFIKNTIRNMRFFYAETIF